MSEENVEIVRRGFEEWRRTRTLDFDLLDPDVEWVLHGTPAGDVSLRGKEGVRGWFADDGAGTVAAVLRCRTGRRQGPIRVGELTVDPLPKLSRAAAPAGCCRLSCSWKIKPTRKKEQGRVVAYYQLERSEPWPGGNVAAEIRRLEREAKKKRR